MLRAARKCGRFAAIWNSGLKFWGICKAQLWIFSVPPSWGRAANIRAAKPFCPEKISPVVSRLKHCCGGGSLITALSGFD